MLNTAFSWIMTLKRGMSTCTGFPKLSLPSQPFDPFGGIFFDFPPQTMKLPLMCTELLCAVFTVQTAVCHRRKTFRMQVKSYFPSEHEDQRHDQQRPRVGFPDEKERSKDHSIVPIVDPA